MNPDKKAILEWVLKNRPEVLSEINTIFHSDTRDDKLMRFLLSVGFEAGRAFQSVNPETTLDPLDPQVKYNPIV